MQLKELEIELNKLLNIIKTNHLIGIRFSIQNLKLQVFKIKIKNDKVIELMSMVKYKYIKDI